MFLVFEGCDGAGKSTQVEKLAEHLRNTRRREVVLLAEPGGTALGEAVRRLLLERGEEPLAAATELFLFMAARSHLVRRRIAPALARGAVVICDRFLLSSVVYQGMVGGVGVEEVLRQGELAIAGTAPDRTFLLDLPVATLLERTRRRGTSDRFEARGARFLGEIREAFLEAARRDPGSVAVIDASGDLEAVHARVLAALPEPSWPRSDAAERPDAG